MEVFTLKSWMTGKKFSTLAPAALWREATQTLLDAAGYRDDDNTVERVNEVYIRITRPETVLSVEVLAPTPFEVF